jgi:hypothetical protein
LSACNVKRPGSPGPAPASQTQPGWNVGQFVPGNAGNGECESLMPSYGLCKN